MSQDCLARLAALNISRDDASALRRIAMTLHRWHELECGDGNAYSSWTITRGRKETRHGQYAGGHGAHYVFIYDEAGKPYLENHPHSSNEAHYSAIPDREKGALKRLAAIMAAYPALTSYVQGDCRGASLYILRADDIPAGVNIDSCYSRGVAVYK